MYTLRFLDGRYACMQVCPLSMRARKCRWRICKAVFMIHVHICTYIHTRTHTQALVLDRWRICKAVSMIHVHICTYIHTHTHTHALVLDPCVQGKVDNAWYMYIHTHTSTYTGSYSRFMCPKKEDAAWYLYIHTHIHVHIHRLLFLIHVSKEK